MLVNSACVLANCLSAMASALLHSDALLALSHLLSSEAQRGPAQALLWPRGLTSCFLPLRQLISIQKPRTSTSSARLCFCDAD